MTEQDIMERLRQSFRGRVERLPVASMRNRWVNRRAFLLGTAASGLAFTQSVGGRQATPGSSPVTDPDVSERLFSLGIASGDQLPDGVVLWTRLAPEPFEPDGGMGEAPLEVQWEIAADERMKSIVQSGTAVAEAARAHSVHVEVSGLEPVTWYGTDSGRAGSTVRSGGRAPRRRRGRASIASASPPASAGTLASTLPTATWRSRIST